MGHHSITITSNELVDLAREALQLSHDHPLTLHAIALDPVHGVVLVVDGPDIPDQPDAQTPAHIRPAGPRILAWSRQFCTAVQQGLDLPAAVRLADRATGLRIAETVLSDHLPARAEES